MNHALNKLTMVDTWCLRWATCASCFSTNLKMSVEKIRLQTVKSWLCQRLKKVTIYHVIPPHPSWIASKSPRHLHLRKHCRTFRFLFAHKRVGSNLSLVGNPHRSSFRMSAPSIFCGSIFTVHGDSHWIAGPRTHSVTIKWIDSTHLNANERGVRVMPYRQ